MDKPKDYFFLLDLKKPNSEDANDKVEFTNPADKDSQPKCIKTKEENDKIVKIFKFSHKLSKNPKPSFEFFFNGFIFLICISKSFPKIFQCFIILFFIFSLVFLVIFLLSCKLLIIASIAKYLFFN